MRFQKSELVGERQNIEQTRSSADSQLAIANGIPGKTDARFEVMKRGVREQSPCAGTASGDHHATDGQQIGEMPEVDQFALRLGRHRGHFIAKSKIQRQVRPWAPVILYIASDEVLPKMSWRQGTGNPSLELRRLILKKCLQIVESPDSIGVRERSGL